VRRVPRYITNAFFYLVDDSGKKATAHLLTISENGLSIICDEYIGIAPNSIYEITIVPEKKTDIGNFKLIIESKWVKLNRTRNEYGFSIICAFNENDFIRYLSYLSSQIHAHNLKKQDLRFPARKAVSPGCSAIRIDLTPTISD